MEEEASISLPPLSLWLSDSLPLDSLSRSASYSSYERRDISHAAEPKLLLPSLLYFLFVFFPLPLPARELLAISFGPRSWRLPPALFFLRYCQLHARLNSLSRKYCARGINFHGAPAIFPLQFLGGFIVWPPKWSALICISSNIIFPSVIFQDLGMVSIIFWI